MQPSILHHTTSVRRELTRRAAVTLGVLAALTMSVSALAQGKPRVTEAPVPASSPAAAVTEKDDGRFHLVLGAFVTAAGTDIASSMYQIGRGSAREAAFGSPWQDSPVAFAATKSALTAFFAYQLQKLHRTRPKAAFILGIAGTSVEAALIARTARLQR